MEGQVKTVETLVELRLIVKMQLYGLIRTYSEQKLIVPCELVFEVSEIGY